MSMNWSQPLLSQISRAFPASFTPFCHFHPFPVQILTKMVQNFRPLAMLKAIARAETPANSSSSLVSRSESLPVGPCSSISVKNTPKWSNFEATRWRGWLKIWGRSGWWSLKIVPQPHDQDVTFFLTFASNLLWFFSWEKWRKKKGSRHWKSVSTGKLKLIYQPPGFLQKKAIEFSRTLGRTHQEQLLHELRYPHPITSSLFNVPWVQLKIDRVFLPTRKGTNLLSNTCTLKLTASF